MTPNLTFEQFSRLLETVFRPGQVEPGLIILVDLPSKGLPDNPAWKDRRRLAAEWYTMLQTHLADLPFREIVCCVYPNVGSNNSDLPEVVTVVARTSEEDAVASVHPLSLIEVLGGGSVILAMTELSATAPLKILARKLGFRGATLPGFSRKMIPALMLDYDQIHARVLGIKERMDAAIGATLVISRGEESYSSFYDLRYRTAHASGGIIREAGTVANLPSGEAYIAPYEGEQAEFPSKTAGTLPVQFEDEIVLFTIRENKCVAVEGNGRHTEEQRGMLAAEVAYGNIAELGIGVLGEWGVQAAGSTLLDEKLGLHIAFGRSEHLGGVTGPGAFRSPKNVIHIDWVYVPSVQPALAVQELKFHYVDRADETVIRSGNLSV